MGQVVEYGQWKNHFRKEALIFGGSLGFKIGTGITSAIITKLMDASGYMSCIDDVEVAGAVAQPHSALMMIQNIYLYGPLIIWAVAVVVLFLYKLDKHYDGFDGLRRTRRNVRKNRCCTACRRSTRIKG